MGAAEDGGHGSGTPRQLQHGRPPPAGGPVWRHHGPAWEGANSVADTVRPTTTHATAFALTVTCRHTWQQAAFYRVGDLPRVCQLRWHETPQHHSATLAQARFPLSIATITLDRHSACYALASVTVNLSCQPLKHDCFACMLQGDRLFSQAHDELYQFSFERQQWGPLALRPPRADRKREAAAAQQQQQQQQDPPATAGAARESAADAAAATALEQRTADGGEAAQPSGLPC